MQGAYLSPQLARLGTGGGDASLRRRFQGGGLFPGAGLHGGNADANGMQQASAGAASQGPAAADAASQGVGDTQPPWVQQLLHGQAETKHMLVSIDSRVGAAVATLAKHDSRLGQLEGGMKQLEHITAALTESVTALQGPPEWSVEDAAVRRSRTISINDLNRLSLGTVICQGKDGARLPDPLPHLPRGARVTYQSGGNKARVELGSSAAAAAFLRAFAPPKAAPPATAAGHQAGPPPPPPIYCQPLLQPAEEAREFLFREFLRRIKNPLPGHGGPTLLVVVELRWGRPDLPCRGEMYGRFKPLVEGEVAGPWRRIPFERRLDHNDGKEVLRAGFNPSILIEEAMGEAELGERMLLASDAPYGSSPARGAAGQQGDGGAADAASTSPGMPVDEGPFGPKVSRKERSADSPGATSVGRPKKKIQGVPLPASAAPLPVAHTPTTPRVNFPPPQPPPPLPPGMSHRPGLRPGLPPPPAPLAPGLCPPPPEGAEPRAA